MERAPHRDRRRLQPWCDPCDRFGRAGGAVRIDARSHVQPRAKIEIEQREPVCRAHAKGKDRMTTVTSLWWSRINCNVQDVTTGHEAPRLPHRESTWTTLVWITMWYAAPPEDRVHPPDAMSIRAARSPPAGRPIEGADRRTSATEPCSRGPPQPNRSNRSRQGRCEDVPGWEEVRGAGSRLDFCMIRTDNRVQARRHIRYPS